MGGWVGVLVVGRAGEGGGGRGRRGSISLYSPPSNSDPGTITLSSEHLVRG